jgi:glucose/arabinose dehydrogenase
VKLCSAFTIVAVLLAVADSRAQTPLRTRVYASGFSRPIAFVQDPIDRTVQYVVEQGGRIRVVRNEAVLPTDFLNLSTAMVSDGEQGLLGLAFAPDYASSGRFFVNFTNLDGNTVIARFRRSSNPLVADATSRFDLRWGGEGAPRFITQPFTNHKGGHLAFGPDGFLYIALGDGGSGGDPGHRAQDPMELLGKMLRIDVNVADGHPSGYEVPAGNPFVGTGTRPEIWSFGWRNPWRYSFDDPARGGTGALLIGDVGQDAWEEINYEPPNRGGRNYGWRNREGAHDYLPSPPPAFQPLTDPIHEYGRSVGAAVVGGHVYRGSALGATYQGRYFFADFVRGRVWSLALIVDSITGEAQASDVVEHTAELGGNVLGLISSFGIDADGELYIVSYASGTVRRVLSGPARGDHGDYDGDGKTDLAFFRPSTGAWWVRLSAVNFTTFMAHEWGVATDLPTPGDYDGDGRTDLAFYRPGTGVWWLALSSTNFSTFLSYQWGSNTDTPLPADYDGDGKTDLAIYRPSTGVWWVLLSSTNFTTFMSQQWGVSTDTPVPADYDGDGKTDLAIYRRDTGVWWVLLSSTNFSTFLSYQWGINTDTPVPADYDGDGKADIAIYRRATGAWWLLLSTTNAVVTQQWGVNTDAPVPADYDGDGKADIAIYRAATGAWWLLLSSTNSLSYATYQWGTSTDVPMTRVP